MEKKRDLLCIGTIAIDRYLFVKQFSSTLKGGEVYRSEMKFGGGAANTALVSKKLGVDSDLLAYVGNDPTGKEYLKHLKKHKIHEY